MYNQEWAISSCATASHTAVVIVSSRWKACLGRCGGAGTWWAAARAKRPSQRNWTNLNVNTGRQTPDKKKLNHTTKLISSVHYFANRARLVLPELGGAEASAAWNESKACGIVCVCMWVGVGEGTNVVLLLTHHQHHNGYLFINLFKFCMSRFFALVRNVSEVKFGHKQFLPPRSQRTKPTHARKCFGQHWIAALDWALA